MTPLPQSTTARGVLALFLVWLAALGALGLFQAAGAGTSLKVGPIAEDHNWLYWLQNGRGLDTARMLWARHGDRNPLSTHWYLAARPLILRSKSGLFLLRRLMDLVAGLCVFALVQRLGYGRQVRFALCCAALCLLWNFNAYLDQLLWLTLGVLCASLLCLWSYCAYVDSGRTRGCFLGLSLLLYLLVVASYTLQASCCLAVFVLGLCRGPEGPVRWRTLPCRAAHALLDTAFFLGVLGLFILVWFTVAPSGGQGYGLMPHLARQHLPTSLRWALYHPCYTVMLHCVWHEWLAHPAGPLALLSVGAFAALLGWAGRWTAPAAAPQPAAARSDPHDPTAHGPDPRGGLPATLGYTAAVAGALWAATLVVESCTPVWTPGTRVVMIQQVFQPLVYCCLIFAAGLVLRRFAPRAQGLAWVAAPAALMTTAFVVGLDYNRRQNEVCTAERRLITAIREALPHRDGPVNLLVRPDGVSLPYLAILAHRCLQTSLKSPDVNMRVLDRGPPVDRWQSFNHVIFGPDGQGVYLYRADDTPGWVPYHQVRVLRYDGRRATVLDTVGPADLAGYKVGFRRDTPARCGPPDAGRAETRAAAAARD